MIRSFQQSAFQYLILIHNFLHRFSDNENYIYHPIKMHRSCTRWGSQSELCTGFQAKRDTLSYVINYMNKELSSSVPLIEQDDGFADGTCGIGIYVQDIFKWDDSMVFLLSDGSVQVRNCSLLVYMMMCAQMTKCRRRRLSPIMIIAYLRSISFKYVLKLC